VSLCADTVPPCHAQWLSSANGALALDSSFYCSLPHTLYIYNIPQNICRLVCLSVCHAVDRTKQ
jgi:hypothetical protein